MTDKYKKVWVSNPDRKRSGEMVGDAESIAVFEGKN